MQLSQRLDQRLHTLRQEVRTMSQEKDREERVWRERLHRCQRQLKAKDEEMSRQCQYFENFKTQLQQKLSLARDREQSLQNRIYALEKQLLDVTVSSATGMATMAAVRITAGTAIHMNELHKLPCMRGEGEGEEEHKEERRKQWQPNVATTIRERPAVDEGKTETDTEGGRDKETKHASNEARLQSFIISLQEDLKVLLEREEEAMTERRKLLEELQEAQENSHVLSCKVEEMKAELRQRSQSENFLMEEVEDLKKENQSLQQILRDAANTAPPLPSLKPETTCTVARAELPFCPDSPSSPLSQGTAVKQSPTRSQGEVLPNADEKHLQPRLSAIPSIDHQGAAEHTQNNREANYPPAKSKKPKQNPHNLHQHVGSRAGPGVQSLFFSTEALTEPAMGNMEALPSEESDALMAAFHSLGFGDDLQALNEQREHLEVELQHTKAELLAKDQENAELKLQLRREAEQRQSAKEQGSSKDKIITSSTCNGDHRPSLNSAKDDFTQGELIQALNQENRALADRIQELLAHIELREEEIKKEQTCLRGRIYKLEEDGVRLEQENQEQVSLISELTRKTEDDLNTIMELRQILEERKEEPQGEQKDHQAGVLGCFQVKKQEKCVESSGDSFLNGNKEAQLNISQETDSSTTASSSSCHQNVQDDSLQNRSQNSPHVSSLTDELAQLNTSVQSLKTEQKDLTADINSLREEQKEVTLSLQRQTEEKQQLTRSVWALKEQKDCIVQSLHGLQQEKEKLSRAVSSLKDERDQCTRSISGLNEEKEELARSLSTLQRDKDVIKESILSGERERDGIRKSVLALQAESDQLSQTVLRLKKQRDELTESLQGLGEQRDQRERAHALKGERDQLMMSVSSLKEDEEKLQQSVIGLKQEQNNIQHIIVGLREERRSLQTQAEETDPELKPRSDSMKTRTGQKDDAPTCETGNHRGKFVQKERDMTREIEALGAELKKSREEVEKSHAEIRKLHSELSQSETRREVVEKKAAEQLTRLTESANQKEDIILENESLSMQVKALQNKLMAQLREKNDALALKAQTEEQYNILAAQLKAKTVALEELNSEYIAVKRGQGSREDQAAALVSLRARYNGIRAKYDALLKRKSQTDLDVAPLKAKLSCLVVKCQERNSLLAEMMKSMHRLGCLEPRLTQQAEHLLSDAALQDYFAAFSPESKIQRREHCTDSTHDFLSVFLGCNRGFMPDPTFPVVSSCLIKQQNEATPESGAQCGKSEKRTSIFANETSANPQACWRVAPAATETLKENSPESTSPSSIAVSPVVPLKESMVTNSPQLSPATGPLQATSRPEKRDSCHVEVKEKYFPDATEVGERSQSPSKASSSTRVSPSRRLSSPEKILNLKEELQKTLMDSFQAPESRGRGQEPRRNLSPSAPTDLHRHFSFSIQHTDSLPVSKFFCPTKHPPVVTTKSDSSNKSPTLFNAVTSRCANAKLSPSLFAPCHLKADGSVTPEPLTSADLPFSSATHRKDSSISSENTKLAAHTDQKKKVITMFDLPDVAHTDAVSPVCGRSARLSPERCHEAATDFTAALGNTSKPRPGAPAEVRSVEVIKPVGQSSLLIGWERPHLDELGCSNATFVYGYRVFVNKEFHKSVMSSACTKCILENIDLSVPVHIGVQTLGSNGLHSESVYTIYPNSNRG